LAAPLRRAVRADDTHPDAGARRLFLIPDPAHRMRSTRLTLIALAAALALGACDRSAPEAPSDGGPQPPEPPAAAADSTPALVVPPEATVPVSERGSNPEPTRADSLAAAKEDVTPEWKQRERSMDSYANCMRQAQVVTGEARRRLEEACANLPTAPR
jgi:hypothetical protein